MSTYFWQPKRYSFVNVRHTSSLVSDKRCFQHSARWNWPALGKTNRISTTQDKRYLNSLFQLKTRYWSDLHWTQPPKPTRITLQPMTSRTFQDRLFWFWKKNETRHDYLKWIIFVLHIYGHLIVFKYSCIGALE